MLSRLKLSRPSLVEGELVQPARLTAKRDENRVVAIDPGGTDMTQPAARRIFHERRGIRRRRGFESGDTSGGRVGVEADASGA